jgi:hypothetical protein
MSLALDGYDILRRIGANPNASSALKADLAKTAETLLKKQLKDRALSLEGYKSVLDVLGEVPMRMMLEAMTPPEILALAK